MPSALFSVGGSSAQVAQVVAFGSTTALAIVNTAGIDYAEWSIVGQSHAATVVTITPGSKGLTATITFPADPGNDWSVLLECKANGGHGSNRSPDANLTIRRVIGTAAYGAQPPACVNESFERDAVTGWNSLLNQILSTGLPFDARLFGADPTGTIDSSAAFLRAIQLANGHPVTFEGTFKFTSPVAYTGKVTLIGKGKTSKILCDTDAFRILDGADSVFDNFWMENITAPWIITRNPSNWSATMTPVQSNGNGYQPTVHDTDVWGSLTGPQQAQNIGPKIYMNGDASRVKISRIYGRFINIFLQGAVGCSVDDCEFRAGKEGINFWNIDANPGADNKARRNVITYASNCGITFARNTDGRAQGNKVSLCGESGIKTYQGTAGAGPVDARCYRMRIEDNDCLSNYYDGIDSTSDSPRTITNDTDHKITVNRCHGNRRTGIYGDGKSNSYLDNRARANGLTGIKLYVTKSTVSLNQTAENNASNTGSGEHEIIVDGDGNHIVGNQSVKGATAGNGLNATGTNYVANNKTTGGTNYFGATPTATLVANEDDSTRGYPTIVNGTPVTSVNTDASLRPKTSNGVTTLSTGLVALDALFTAAGLPDLSEQGTEVAFSRASTAGYYVDGVWTNAAANVPRLTPDGIVTEGPKTNIITNTVMTGWYLAFSATVALSPRAAVDGATYYRISQGAANGFQAIGYLGPAATGTPQSYSVVIVKTATVQYAGIADNAAAIRMIVNLKTGEITGTAGTGVRAYVEDLGDEWRLSLSCDTGLNTGMLTVFHSSNGTVYAFAGNTSVYVDVRSPECEDCAYATSVLTAASRAGDICTVAIPGSVGAEFAIEVEFMPVGPGNTYRGATHEPIVAVGAYTGANSIEMFLLGSGGAGAAVCEVYDNAAAAKRITLAALASSGYYDGPKRLVLKSRGIAQNPGLINDAGFEATVTVSGSGTGIYGSKSMAQRVLRIGHTRTVGAAYVYGGVVIRRVRVWSTSAVSPRYVGAQGYTIALPRGHRPNNQIFASIGDSNCNGRTVDASITRPWTLVAAETKGQLWGGHNYGIGGDCVEQAATRWEIDLKGRGYRTVVWQCGINDTNNDRGIAVICDAIEAAFTDMLANGVTKIVFVALMPGGDHTSSTRYAVKTGINARMQAWCTAHNQTYYDLWTRFLTGTTNPIIDPTYNLNTDGLHLNQAGHTIVGAEIAALL